jgi:DNA recombination protein RmuC
VNELPLLLVVTGLSALLAGLALGVLLGRRGQSALERDNARLEAELGTGERLRQEREEALRRTEERLAAAFGELAGRSLSSNSEAFLRLAEQRLLAQQERARAELMEREKAVAGLVAPIREALDKTAREIGAMEKARNEAYGGIRSQLAAMTADQQALQTETRNLVNALRRPQVRGQWGELTLRRVAELAGMVEHCDFTEQETVAGTDGAMRPDMIVRLPDRGELVVDVKTPLDAYIEAMDAANDQDRRVALQRHARNVADRVRELSAKAYWAQFPSSPEFVILFIPGDQFLTAALSENPGLLEDALRNKVVLATPSSLVALLKAIAYGWRQLSLERNAEEIRRLGQDLYDRLAPFVGHLARLGRALEGSVKAFNDSVGSLERKVLPGARKLTELGISSRQALEAPAVIETAARDTAAAGEPVSEPRPEPEPPGDGDDVTRAH